MQHTHIDHAIDYIEFTAPDLPAIKKFYGDVFGWIFQDWGDEYASFSDGRVDAASPAVKSVKAQARSSSSILPALKLCRKK